MIQLENANSPNMHSSIHPVVATNKSSRRVDVQTSNEGRRAFIGPFHKGKARDGDATVVIFRVGGVGWVPSFDSRASDSGAPGGPGEG